MRTVVESKEVQKINDKYLNDPVFRDTWEALKWTLSINPDIGIKLKGTNKLLYKQSNDNLPSIVVIYSFNSNEVNIEFVNIIKNQN